MLEQTVTSTKVGSSEGALKGVVFSAVAKESTVLSIPSQKKIDIFDEENFSATKFINKIYPDEKSLNDLDRFTSILRTQIRNIDKEIFSTVRKQGSTNAKASEELETAKQRIAQLRQKVIQIRDKSEESERMVQEICHDIRRLDFAKGHLTSAITALRRLAMLSAAISDLEQAVTRCDPPRRTANLLEAVHQLMDFFQQYGEVPKIKSLAYRLEAVSATLQTAVLEDFRVLMNSVCGGGQNMGGSGSGSGTSSGKQSSETLQRIQHSCTLVDALGLHVRSQLLDWLCDREVVAYQAVFGASSSSMGEASRLDRFEKRFQWFKARSEDRKELWTAFPPDWRVPQMVGLTFCRVTKAQLKNILTEAEAAAVAAAGGGDGMRGDGMRGDGMGPTTSGSGAFVAGIPSSAMTPNVPLIIHNNPQVAGGSIGASTGTPSSTTLPASTSSSTSSTASAATPAAAATTFAPPPSTVVAGSPYDVATLIKAVVATNKFERDMAAAFGGACPSQQGDADDINGDDEGGGGNNGGGGSGGGVTDNINASQARKRLERYRVKAKTEALHKQLATKVGGAEKMREAEEAVKGEFLGSISEAFDDLLCLRYVGEERRELFALQDNVLREEYQRHWLSPEDAEAGIGGG
eukprot:CAMPEP_0175063804 /NCGR_PEP_ID=MMETSP0052_2-20121109/14968_1 /TAXON_ID=51329 ORGANISM="Polytomella parva, Strain SAG 63-3" /NCGR_SAMPLE_ID=MMETSP0052_2 /ASSEMBLY_ACC=CAM_ASM_000194 /LENGTH=634 /DNA_ID=CAMNT_0016330059 /DNA_START=108 /DNA_END=2008 /DNA_ORIENTATION=-